MKKYRKPKKLITFLLIIVLTFNQLLYFTMNSEWLNASAYSAWTQTSDKDFDNGTLNNLTIVGIGENAELEIDFSDIDHWKKPNPPNSPSEGHQFGMTTICTDDKVVLFGGVDLDETWEYDLSANTWTKKNTSINSNQIVGPEGPERHRSIPISDT